MDRKNAEQFARLVKQHRLQKKYTQQDLAEQTGISIRSIQRIENAEVLPRLYTLNVLANQLGFTFDAPDIIEEKIVAPRFNRSQKMVLSVGVALLFLLLACAFVFQSATFPENQFELSLYIAFIIAVYTVILLGIWR